MAKPVTLNGGKRRAFLLQVFAISMLTALFFGAAPALVTAIVVTQEARKTLARGLCEQDVRDWESRHKNIEAAKKDVSNQLRYFRTKPDAGERVKFLEGRKFSEQLRPDCDQIVEDVAWLP